ncbi:hypothetical protein BDW22DRAFT_1383675 [Trametopsis cervina]|nr:hypothetical protein BDW22DRAFT_1383675 [Trametopsis cervina]
MASDDRRPHDTSQGSLTNSPSRSQDHSTAIVNPPEGWTSELHTPVPGIPDTEAAGPSSISSPGHSAVEQSEPEIHGGSGSLTPTRASNSEDAHSSRSESVRPTNGTINTSRRARVEEEEDEDEQRETNRQRMTSPDASDSTDAEHLYHPDLHAHERERQREAPQPHPQQPNTANGGPPPIFHRIAFTVDWFPAGQMLPGAGNPTFFPPAFGLVPMPTFASLARDDHTPNPNGSSTQSPDRAATATATPPGGSGAPEINHFLQQLRDSISQMPTGGNGPLPPGTHVHHGFPMFPFPGIFTGMDMEEPDDPSRAKRLLAGLEEVPSGLIKRMERLGEEDGEMPVCAVCFDDLLEPADDSSSDAKGSEHADHSEDAHMDVDAESTVSNDPTISSAASTSGSSTTSTETAQAVDTSLDHRVFVLPCAHAFHGSCLRPWFTRPHRTTCPTCRFDIDPESLTYVPPTRSQTRDAARRELARARARLRARQAAATAVSAGAPSTGPANPPPAYQPSESAADETEVPHSPPNAPSPTFSDILLPPPPAPVHADGGAGTRPRGPGPAFFDMPVGVIFDFSMVVPAPRPRAAGTAQPPPPTHAQNPQPANDGQRTPGQAQRAPPSGTPAAPGQPGPNLDPSSAGRVHLDAAGMDLVEQILRNMFSTIMDPGAAPPPGTDPAVPTRGASEPPTAGIRQPPFGPLPAFGTGDQGPLPSFDELMELVEGFPVTDGQVQPTGPSDGSEATPEHVDGEEHLHPQDPPPDHHHVHPFGNIMHGIQHMASNVLHRMFPPGGPGQGEADGPTPAQGTNNAHPHPHPPGPIPFTIPAMPRARGPRPPAGPKREWTVPPPPGPTLRERIEKKERERGWRCSDISCGVGPTDEDPVPVIDPRAIRQIGIKPTNGESKESVCEHTFHPSCLVSAERVAGWNGADQKEEVQGEESVQVSCPVCRAVGSISRNDWDEGACALA